MMEFISIKEILPRFTDWYKIMTEDGRIKKSFFIRDIHGGTSWERLAKKDRVKSWKELD